MLGKNISRLLQSYATIVSSSSSSHHHHHHLLLGGAHGFSAVANTQNPPLQPILIAQYLIDSCGFSPEIAARASKPLARIRSPSNPHSVIQFFKQIGLDDADIRVIIPWMPSLLCADVEATLKPKVRDLQQAGFSESEISQLIVSCPIALSLSNLCPKIKFWRSFYGNNNDKLLKFIKGNPYLLSSSMDKKIIPNVSLLRKSGLSDSQIARLVLRNRRLITRTFDSIKVILGRAEELGIPSASGMFFYAVSAVSSVGQAKVEAKFRLLRRLGCSDAEIKAALRVSPNLLLLSEKKIQGTMDFLAKEAGCGPSYVMSRPVLLYYSFERRLVPRVIALQILRSKGRCSDVYTAVACTEKRFLRRFILPHKEEIPELHDAYIAACVKKVTAQPDN